MATTDLGPSSGQLDAVRTKLEQARSESKAEVTAVLTPRSASDEASAKRERGPKDEASAKRERGPKDKGMAKRGRGNPRAFATG